MARGVAAARDGANGSRATQRMRDRDPARRAALVADLQATAADPAKAHAYLLRSSMIAGLRLAATVD